MNIHETKLPGVLRIQSEPAVDSRGCFIRTYCEKEFADQGLNTYWPQSNLSMTQQRGAIRGMHYQLPPSREAKLIRCVSGSVYDVIVDMRPASPTLGQWVAFELTEDSGCALYVAEGCAHGFQCLTEKCRLYYQMASLYDASLDAGVRWNDPDLGIRWPLEVSMISNRDASLPLFSEMSLGQR